ncbi:MAG: xylose isomerase [Planctomycetota bacterium]
MPEFFPDVKPIAYEGPDSTNPLAFKHYDASAEVAGKTMAEHMRFAACYWHCMRGAGADPFGPGTRIMPWEQDASDEMDAALRTMHAHFEFCQKLTVPYWCFHDRDIAPEVEDDLAETNRRLDTVVDLAEKLQGDTGIKLLWGTANLFSHKRFMSGAGTSPFLDAFAHGAAQVKKAMEVTHRLGGEGYVFWGGREGYDTLLNTKLDVELAHLARLLGMAVEYKKELDFRGQFYIEPKPKEPTTHQYDYDAATCHAFLQKFELDQDFQLNIEANHATLAGHSFHHELEYCRINGLLGSIDANRGGDNIGWDTDQFPTNLYDTTLCMLTLLKNGGFTTGGLNFDAKVRRQSSEPIDLFYAHIGGMDAFARGLKAAAGLLEDGTMPDLVTTRYQSWSTDLGQQIEAGDATLADCEKHALSNNLTQVPSSRQELFENMLNIALS